MRKTFLFVVCTIKPPEKKVIYSQTNGAESNFKLKLKLEFGLGSFAELLALNWHRVNRI